MTLRPVGCSFLNIIIIIIIMKNKKNNKKNREQIRGLNLCPDYVHTQIHVNAFICSETHMIFKHLHT